MSSNIIIPEALNDYERVWDPFKKQRQFIELPFSVFEALYGGAAGGGKSELLVLLPLIYGFIHNRYFKGLILRRKYPELESEIIIRSHEFYPKAGGVYNSQKRRWQFPSGAFIFFGHAEYTNDIRNYDGAEYQYVAFDELTHFEEFMYLYMIGSRMRAKIESNLPIIARNASNPGNIGHAWVRRRFVEPAPNGSKILYDRKTESKRFFLQAKATDNPHIDAGYIRKLELLPEAEKRAKLYGDWWTFSGQVFTDFRVEPLPGEPDNARHVIEPVKIPDFWPRIISIDWGTSALTIANFYAVSPDTRVFHYDEFACNGGDNYPHLDQNVKVSTWGTEIGRRAQGINLKGVVLDQNAWDNTNEDQSVAAQFETYSKLVPEKATKGPGSRKAGRVLLEEYLRWKPRPKLKIATGTPDIDYAQFVFRMKGSEAYREYLSQFEEEEDETNIPKLQIFNTCKETIRVIPLCIWDETNIEDVQEFHGDDPYDCTRYGLKLASHFVHSSKREFDRLQKVENAIQAINSHNFYMQMAKIESDVRNRKSSVSLRGKHRWT